MQISNTEQINIYIDEYIKENFDSNFKWRENQLETVKEILNFYLENPNGIYILEGPTGSGKSIIGMTVAGILEKMQHRGYILTSDLALQSQYEDDIEKMYRVDWGSVKGIDNYTCTVTGERFSLGECKQKSLSLIETKKLPCYETCGYYQARTKASRSNVSILNYSYWLIMMNYVKEKMDRAMLLFDNRKFTICDEAHKITSIVQNHFSPKLSSFTIEALVKLRQFLAREFAISVDVPINDVTETIQDLFEEEDLYKLQKLLQKFEKQLLEFVISGEKGKKWINNKYKNKNVPKKYFSGLNLIDVAKDYFCKIQDYNEIINKTSVNYLVKNKENNDKITFNCIEENYLMRNYFYNQCNFILMMSATIGSEKNFSETSGLNKLNKPVKFKKLENTFNFEKSPIFVWSKHKMSWNKKEQTLPWLKETIKTILYKHYNERGIIHTGSYDLTQKIFDSLDPKLKNKVLMYIGSDDKKMVLSEFEKSKNLVLMGPSLLEGLDFYDDKSRFQIFAKVPYASLNNNFIKRKMKMQPNWYQWNTIMALQQGIGRSIRNKDDWAITYFLDGCLMDLLRYNQRDFNCEIIDRLRIIKD